MTPERFRQIEELYHAAREGTAEERAALLAQTDPELRREIESLLAHHTGGELLDQPAMQIAPQLLENSTVAILTPGVYLGPYRIESKLGEGGMGEVFRAVDTRLGRAVAIKTTREQFNERFEREARAISSLNHPNVCTLYDVGPNYLVMELVEGETIAALLKTGPLDMKTAILYASQILAGLAEAHSKGIVHRDLKPGNVMIARTGVKVLDFGLAKSGTDDTVTGSHMAIGTPAYMAPEQRKGKPADARADIYAFGCMLYEMLAGTQVGPNRRRIGPGKLERIVNRCLEEDPARRWQSAAELQRELAAISLPRRRLSLTVALIAIVASCVAAYVYLHRPPKLTAKDTIVLADFANSTVDPVFDDALRQGLAVQLEQSPFLSLVSDRRIQEVLRLMNQPADARLTFEVAREICERNGSAAVLQGSISSLGTHYVLGLRATNCRTGDVLDEEQVQAARKEAVLDALSQIASKFRSRVGESLATVEKYDTPLPEATTRSLEALKAYSAALSTFRGSADAVPYFKRAIEIDPNFAMAYAMLGRMYSDTGESALSAESTRRAYELQNRASDKEKFFITTSYSTQVTGNLEQARESCELWAQAYPRSFEPHGHLSGIIYPALGLFDKSGEESKKAVALHPGFSFGYSNLAMSLIARDRLEEAELVLQQGAARGLAIPEFSILRYDIAFLRGDQAAMQREVSLAAGQSDVEDWLSSHQAQVLAYVGRLEEARKVSRRSRDLAQQAGHLEKAAMYETEELVREALFGNHATAKQLAPQALGLSKGRDVEFGVAFGLTLAGNRVDAKNLMQDLARRFPEDTVVQRRYLPTLLAMSALEQGEAAKAIDLLETASPYELGIPGNSFFGTLGNLYPIYVRGQAYLALHRGSDSSAEFQKIIDRRGIVVSDPVGALAYLQRGRAQAIGSDIPRASATYEGFFKLWKDADTDVAILKQAKAEYAKLQ